MECVIPNSVKHNRGKSSINEIFFLCKKLNCRFILYIDSNKGNPSRILLYDFIQDKIRYELKIIGISTLSDFKIRRKRIDRICIRNIECKELIPFLIDLNLFNISSCDNFVDMLKKDEVCEMKFVSKFEKLVGPIIRIHDFNNYLNRWNT
ncbi:hypothetical protein HS5_22080 [Acidianus sp. HS-5]|nr:hypothetical protein HS5_22080 [Acidianus sp. HS-5]